ncbi:MAG: universal stress protein [Anaerolineae bacterium]|nr:universal stress protein [Anaerolineae bacterium]
MSALAEGPAAETILHVAQERKIDLLILSRQHPGLERFLLGGVARFVVDRAPCSVLLR